MNKKRIVWIDAAKGLAILLVMLGRIEINIPIIGKYLIPFRMPLYFIITGYFISNCIVLKNFIGKRLKRLIIPYFFYGILINCIVLFSLWLKDKITMQTVVEKFIGLLYSRYCLLPLGTDGNTYYLSTFAPAWF